MDIALALAAAFPFALGLRRRTVTARRSSCSGAFRPGHRTRTARVIRTLRLNVVMAVAVAVVAPSPGEARAATSPQEQLAARYAPVVALKKQVKPCGPGEGYRPVLVDLVLGRGDVSLFDGSGGRYRRLRRAPTAADLARGPVDHFVDLPGHPVSGSCSYERWFERIGAQAPNAVYAHVATERGRPGRLALQYWLYYVFNDFNDKHESDWELVQLHFDVGTARKALGRAPVEAVYSQHFGAERAGWDERKLEKVGGTHVVTYPGAGSHANYFSSALWLGRNPGEGLGCDNSTGPSTRVRPRAVVLPTRSEPGPRPAWITFEGHWGQRERGFNDGPTGPNTKRQWTQPFTWAESVERARSFTVPGNAHAGLDSSDVFCSGVTTMSELLDAFYASTWVSLVVIALLLALVTVGVTRTQWRPAPVRPLEQRRSAGQILRVSLSVYRLDWRSLFVVSALVLPVVFLAALATHLLVNLGPAEALVDALGRESSLPLHGFVLVLAAVESVPLGLSVAATALVVASLRLGAQQVGASPAYRLAIAQAVPLAGLMLRVVVIPLALALTIVGLPFAIWYAGRIAVALPAAVIEQLGAGAAIRRSKELVGRHVWHVTAVMTVVLALALLLGPLVGAIVLLNTELPVLVANLLGIAISAAVMPLVGIALSLLFFDLRMRRSSVASAVAAEPAPTSAGRSHPAAGYGSPAS